ncbi:MAG: hypothetical protein Q7U06_01470 [Pseudomonadota bacterium]|nr:hypothetical protein [Pseudomonadota bacterium]
MIRVRPPAVQWPFDLVRWALEETLRGALPPEEPEILRFLAGIGWRFEQRLTPGRALLLGDEARRCFGANVRTATAIVREAQDLALQARMERLVLPRMRADQLDAVVRVEGAPATPAVVLYPHTANVDLLVAALAWRAPGLVVFSARGLPPASVGAVGAVRPTRINSRLARSRAEDDARLPIRWEADAAALAGWLARGHVVAAAFDDRAWPTYVRVPFLGREALLSAAPYALARDAGVPLHFASIRRERDKSSRVVIGPPVVPELGAWLRDHATPFLRAYPGHYAGWLAECRMRANLDDHPLFADYAPDARWLRWPVYEAPLRAEAVSDH